MVAQASWLSAADLEPECDDDDEDTWQVVLAPGEVKVLTLEQLDDLYRLEIIDEATKLRRVGEREWTTLAVVAGLEFETPLAPIVPLTAVRANPGDWETPRAPLGPIPQMAHPSQPPPGRAAAPGRSTPPPPRLNATHPPPAAAHAPASRLYTAAPDSSPRSAPAPVSSGAQVIPWPSSAPSAQTAAPVAAAPRRIPDSLRPMASDLTFEPPRSSSGGGWVITLGLCAGLALTLYRNDVLRDLALRAGQHSSYVRLEAALGAPSFGTPRSLEEFRQQASGMPQAPVAAPAAAATPTEVATPAANAAPVEKAATPQAPVAMEKLPAVKAPPVAEAAREEAPREKSTAKAPSRPAKAHAATARAVKASSLPSAPSAQSKKRAKSAASAYDPLNPDL